MSTTTKRHCEADKPLVFIERARCPACESTNLQTRRTTKNGDDTVSRDTQCRDCGKKFLVVVE